MPRVQVTGVAKVKEKTPPKTKTQTKSKRKRGDENDDTDAPLARTGKTKKGKSAQQVRSGICTATPLIEWGLLAMPTCSGQPAQ